MGSVEIRSKRWKGWKSLKKLKALGVKRFAKKGCRKYRVYAMQSDQVPFFGSFSEMYDSLGIVIRFERPRTHAQNTDAWTDEIKGSEL